MSISIHELLAVARESEGVYTVEGNSGDAVRERNYAISSDSIMGYGMVVY